MKIKVTGTGSSQKKICCEKAKAAISIPSPIVLKY